MIIIFKTIIFISLFTFNLLYAKNFNEWHSSGGTDNLKYSSLDQITPDNIKKLEFQWEFNSGNFESIQLTPIYAENQLITVNREGYLISLNPSSGEVNWKSILLKREVARRGVLYHKGNLFVPTFSGIAVIRIDNGLINTAYANNGYFKSNICSHCDVSYLAPIIKDNKLFVANTTNITSFELDSGKLIFYVDLKSKNLVTRIWSGFSLDIESNSIFVATSNAIYYKDSDIGKGGFSNSLIAIDANSGNILWQVREIEHDLWDLDMVGAPIVTNLTIENKKVRCVIGLSKTGNILVVNAKTGDLVYKADYKTLTDSNLYPPIRILDIKKPKPISKTIFTSEDLNFKGDKSDTFLHHITRNHKEGIVEPSIDWDVIIYGIHGGPQWPGGSYDPLNNLLTVPTNNYPWIVRTKYISTDQKIVSKNILKNLKAFNKCITCHGSSLNGWEQDDLNGDVYVPSLINLEKHKKSQKIKNLKDFKLAHQYLFENRKYTSYEYEPFFNQKIKQYNNVIEKRLKLLDSFIFFLPSILKDKIINIFNLKKIDYKYKNYVDNLNAITEEDIRIVSNSLKKIDKKLEEKNKISKKYTAQVMLDKNLLPASKPPWGKIITINMDSMNVVWDKSFGITRDYENNINYPGAMNFGGTLSLKSNVLFATGTKDKHARAYNQMTGDLLWEVKLPASGSSPPMTFLHEGCQYIIFNSTGTIFYGFERSDSLVAYKLSNCNATKPNQKK